MRKNILFAIGFLAIVILNAFAFAQKNDYEKTTFNINTANQTFNDIQKKLALKTDYNSLVFYVSQIDDLQSDAKKCEKDADSHLKLIDDLLKTTQADRLTQLHRADSQYLQQKQAHYAQSLSDCRLFVYRSQEVLSDYKAKIQKLSAHRILTRNTPIWKIHEGQWLKSFEDINVEKIIVLSGITLISSNQWIVGVLLILFSVFFALYIQLYLKRMMSTMESENTLWKAFLNVVSNFIFPIIIFASISAFLNVIYMDVVPTPTIELLSHASLILVFSIALSKYLFYPSRFFIGLLLFPVDLGRIFFKRVVVLLIVLFFGYIVAITFREQSLGLSLIEISRTIYITAICMIAAWVFLLWHRSPHATRIRHVVLLFFSAFFSVMLIALLLIEWSGYHRLAVFIMSGLCLTIIYTVVAATIWRLIEVIYQMLDNKQYAIARRIHQIFGVKFNKKMHEISLLKVTAYFVVACLYTLAILKSWSISSTFVDPIIDGLIDGFKFLGLNIMPLRIVLAICVFAIIFLVGRFVATSIAKKQQFKGEEDTQIAISTITIYVTFAIALVFALLLTGIDFTGLAIIAGALSVGVGLGLQTIVNNFVSGLILLIEKPIKPGDRIIIGKTEGFVRKIRIRSTQIATAAKEDVIVPNADLITQQVTNYMFRDRNLRFACEFSLAYETDANLVKKILLEVANKHNDIVHEEPNEPHVLFLRFGDNGLIFQLSCVIHDVNKKSMVISDLNFAIDAAFRQYEIQFSNAQRDVHIKDVVRVRSEE